MGRILWQGKSEQKWRLGQLVPPESSDGQWTQHLDFVWLANDDPRSLSSCDHHNKLSLYGSQEELARLAPILVATLNASRAANHLPRTVAAVPQPAATPKDADPERLTDAEWLAIHGGDGYVATD